ncbi:site-specific DNA-methyltransferase [Romeria aff. gracilis LEGE 07310]|uniref:site-specific DNA-methyltransferase (cytosine-N(4)-specific) n=1 Tax=Vasconcelosia minhoensis LEGE 07310 TaxID=915328 RepID=A0A8J7DEN1_9CYAN|nr:DNA methyltransferase [Romeria gracilis]MBE9079898.1 site-specific DNA-methyltransferase [Romeria aff. gracilis LEGE 07310]
MEDSIDMVPKPKHRAHTFRTAVERWASIGPYYAMFPVDFAFDVIEKYTEPGGRVFDPFVGRGSSIYAASAKGRTGCGIEINPVGWVYSSVKLRPTTQGRVVKRLHEIGNEVARVDVEQAKLPTFFHWAYSTDVLRFLLVAREKLRWRESKIDRTLMAFILVYLHGKRPSALSNQMRDSKAMAPDYAVRWWAERQMMPPEVDPITFLEKRITWRYKKGQPDLPGEIILGDSLRLLSSNCQRRAFAEPFDLLFTSPPYCGITNYHYDQWLRLWMLGQPPLPRRLTGRWQKKFESRSDYCSLLAGVFGGAALRMKEEAVVVVRTDAREFTLNATIEALKAAFPNKQIFEERRPFVGQTQTSLYGDHSRKPGEVDLVMLPI